MFVLATWSGFPEISIPHGQLFERMLLLKFKKVLVLEIDRCLNLKS